MGVKLLESLEMQIGLPLDSRDIVTNVDQRNNIEPAVRYIGMEVYVSEENKKYRLEDGIENFNWKEIKAVANASELITDDDHLTVSKTEKETWSGKAEKVHTHTKKDITDFTHTHSKSEINDFPESLKNPSSLTIKLNGTPTVYDGSTVEEVNITPASIGAQPSGNYALATHNHDGVYQPKGEYAQLTHTHDYVPLTRKINVSEGLTGSGILSDDLTIGIDYSDDISIEEILNKNLLKEVFELATEQDVRNLFVGTVLEGGETYDLSALSNDETKMVNMKLLSLYNDLISNKFKGQTDELKTAIDNLKKIQVVAGTGLNGGGALTSNITLSLDYGTDTEIENILK